jgi:hypothetical protein
MQLHLAGTVERHPNGQSMAGAEHLSRLEIPGLDSRNL